MTALSNVLAAFRVRWKTWSYILVSTTAILVAARAFYGEMHSQTGGEWSAPLDDVFIHFDYARSIARGYPFQWSEGNGYSSGNTSITYPFVLALGYWVGFRAQSLMLWAAIVACCSTLAFLLACHRLTIALPSWARLLVPLVVLSLGALDWSLFSGMEVAFFLGVWGWGLVLATDLRFAPPLAVSRAGWKLGIVGALLVATRPEAATSLAVLGLSAGWLAWRSHRSATVAIATVARAGLPAIAFLITQAVVNKLLTGESSASGAIVKLAINNPFMTPEEKWNDYLFHLSYTVRRNIEHHFASVKLAGFIPVALALVALASRRTRGAAAILLASCTSFLLLVAMNGQVRWQNERYTMPAVAWLFVAAALGLGALLSGARTALQRVTLPLRVPVALALATLFVVFQAPKMKDQIWFFGRASRNIRDQHLRAGQVLRRLNPLPRRVAVGDAGALMYSSDLPGLDIIGLGGYHRFPFARAGVHGIGATIELIERMPPADRPDVFAIYPTWFPDVAAIFGRPVASVWVEGNVICGGAEKGIYRADWRLLGTGDRPRTIKPDEVVLDTVDIADLISEQEHHYVFQGPQTGFVQLRVLPDPADTTRDLFDAGRSVLPGRRETFTLRAPTSQAPARLIIRSAPVDKGRLEVSVNSQPVGAVEVTAADGWSELSVPLPPSAATGQPIQVSLTARDMREWTHFHSWLVERP